MFNTWCVTSVGNGVPVERDNSMIVFTASEKDGHRLIQLEKSIKKKPYYNVNLTMTLQVVIIIGSYIIHRFNYS